MAAPYWLSSSRGQKVTTPTSSKSPTTWMVTESNFIICGFSGFGHGDNGADPCGSSVGASVHHPVLLSKICRPVIDGRSSIMSSAMGDPSLLVGMRASRHRVSVEVVHQLVSVFEGGVFSNRSIVLHSCSPKTHQARLNRATDLRVGFVFGGFTM